MPTNYQVVITAIVYKSEVCDFSGTFWIQSFIYDSTYSYNEMGVGVLALQGKPSSTAPEARIIITFYSDDSSIEKKIVHFLWHPSLPRPPNRDKNTYS